MWLLARFDLLNVVRLSSAARFSCVFSSLICLTGALSAEEKPSVLHRFEKRQLTKEFWAEGACSADVNQDGQIDVLSGPFWYAGPNFGQRHEIYPPEASFKSTDAQGKETAIRGFEGALGKKNAYSDNFLSYALDLNGDQWTDYLVIGFPGKELTWFENPKNQPGHWKKHTVVNVLDNESPMLADIDGDGRPEVIGGTTDVSLPEKQRGFLGFAQFNWKEPDQPGVFRRITPAGAYQRFTHGIGAGDINGDGRTDLLENGGWWEQPANFQSVGEWKKHEFSFGKAGAQMFVYDVNGDGLNDVITSLEAHGYGVAWYEQIRTESTIDFKRHYIVGRDPSDTPFGLVFTQPHAIDLADIDGDGLKDLVTGKRFWAHGSTGDVDPNAPAVLYWFKLTRLGENEAEWVPYFIDDDSGVGTQVMVTHLNGDQLPDILVGNKKGLFLHLHETTSVSHKEWQAAQPERRFFIDR